LRQEKCKVICPAAGDQERNVAFHCISQSAERRVLEDFSRRMIFEWVLKAANAGCFFPLKKGAAEANDGKGGEVNWGVSDGMALPSFIEASHF
jgi:hypothetical protein